MNKRIDKKIHTRHLSDVEIEVSQDKEWESRLSQLGVGEVAKINAGNLPVAYILNYH